MVRNDLNRYTHIPTMFTGKRSQSHSKCNSGTSELTSAFTSLANAVTGAIEVATTSKSTSASHVTSPGRVADIHSKYIQQLRDIHFFI